MKLDKKNIMLLGIAVGVMLFFIGIALNITMGPTTEDNKLPAQVSSIVKLSGIGIATLSIFVGGIFIDKLEMIPRVLLAVFGLVLLILNIIIISLVPYY